MKDINMQEGWRVQNLKPFNSYIAVFNFSGTNKVLTCPFPDKEKTEQYLNHAYCIGRWQPKGTKNNR